MIEGLFASDLAFLEALYDDFNAGGDTLAEPHQSKANGARAGGLQRIAALGEA